MPSKINRRKFIIAGAGCVAATGIGYLAKDYLSSFLENLYVPKSTPTPTPTLTHIPNTTPAPIPTQPPNKVDVELRLFHDYHGDGAKQDDEPVITDAVFDVIDEKGDKVLAENTGNGNGVHKIDDLLEDQKYKIEFSEEIRRKFRCISISNAEFRNISEFEFIADSSISKISLGLIVGPLTLPITQDVKVRGEPYYVDLDLGPIMRGWRGGDRVGHDNHFGIDYIMPEDETIVAAAPGEVIEAEGNWPDVLKDPNLGLWDDGNRVTINHGPVPPYNKDFYTIYCHLKEVSCFVGQKVNRGEKIAKSGNTGYKTKDPHLHFQSGGFGRWRIDPYRDVNEPDSVCYWTKDNDPQYPNPD